MNKQKLPSIIPILILTLVTVVMWVSLDIYRAIKHPVEFTVPTEISQPLTPTLDQDAINQVESRTFLLDSQIPEIVASPSPVAAGNTKPSPTLAPTVAPTAQPTSASGSGTTQ
jgi:hypothetical protein